MPAKLVTFLTEQLARSKCFLEYGAGGSTRLAAQLGVPHVFSVESDVAFAKAVRSQAARDAKAKGTKARMVIMNMGKTGNWGYPVDDSLFHKWPKYPTVVWERMAEEGLTPDLVLVDGRFRVACFLVSLIKAKPGTMLILDDFLDRKPRYGVVEKYVAPTELCTRAGVFHVPERLPVADIALDIARYVVDKR